MIERRLYPPELDPQEQRGRFDPETEGRRYGLSRELSLAIWKRTHAEATDGFGRCDVNEARRRFHELAARLAARGAMLRPAVGRMTRVGTEILGEPFDDRGARQLAPRVPGRETLVAIEARRQVHAEWDSAGPDDAARSARPELQGTSEVPRAVATLQDAAQPDRATAPAMDVPMPARGLLDLRAWAPPGRRDAGETAAAAPGSAAIALRERLQRTFGEDARDVELRPDDGRAGTAEAVTVNETVFIGRWGDADALLRVGHEVAHAIQQRRGRAAGETDAAAIPSDQHASLELEAEHAGHALMGGLPFAVRGAVPPAIALFRGGPELPPATQPADDAAQQRDPRPPPAQRPGQEQSSSQRDADHGARGDAAVNPEDAAHTDTAGGKNALNSRGADSLPAQPSSHAAPGAPATAAEAAPGADPGGSTGAVVGSGGADATPPATNVGAVNATDPGSLLGSLGQAPASSLPATLSSVQAATPQAFQSMRTQAQDEMPKVPTPTGLPARPAGAAASREAASEATATQASRLRCGRLPRRDRSARPRTSCAKLPRHHRRRPRNSPAATPRRTPRDRTTLPTTQRLRRAPSPRCRASG